MLKQKYLIYACDNGSDQIRFKAVATDADGSADHTLRLGLFEEYGIDVATYRRFLYRDEAGTVHYDGNATDPLWNLGYLESTASPPTSNVSFPLTLKPIAPHLKYLSFDEFAFTFENYPHTNILSDSRNMQVTEEFDTEFKELGWRILLNTYDWSKGTEGGALPGTIEAAAPFTPLNTSHFDTILSSNDNNIQAAMDTIDDHTHTTSTDLNVTKTLQLSGDITPSALTANQNNYNPTGWSAAVVMRLQTDGTNRTITGLAGGTDGRIAILINIDSANIISLQDEGGASTAANRFTLPTSATLLNIHPDASVVLQYDSTSSRWRVLSLMDHALLTGIGSNTHSQIDTHISSTHLAFNDGEGNPADPGSASADGTSAYAARRDHVHKGPTKAVIIFPTNALQDTVNASSTEYLAPFVDGNFGTEKAMGVTRNGTIKNFYVRQVGNQPASGSLVCHVRQNTASDIISITIAAGAAGPATRSETATSVAVSAGDFIGFKFVNNATAVSATIGFVVVEIEFDP